MSDFPVERLRHDLRSLWDQIDVPIALEEASFNRLTMALDELATLRGYRTELATQIDLLKQEGITLRARVADLAAWRERAMPVMQALTQMCESVVVNARDPELALKFLDDVIEDLGPTAYALLSEGGQG